MSAVFIDLAETLEDMNHDIVKYPWQNPTTSSCQTTIVGHWPLAIQYDWKVRLVKNGYVLDVRGTEYVFESLDTLVAHLKSLVP